MDESGEMDKNLIDCLLSTDRRDLLLITNRNMINRDKNIFANTNYDNLSTETESKDSQSDDDYTESGNESDCEDLEEEIDLDDFGFCNCHKDSSKCPNEIDSVRMDIDFNNENNKSEKISLPKHSISIDTNDIISDGNLDILDLNIVDSFENYDSDDERTSSESDIDDDNEDSSIESDSTSTSTSNSSYNSICSSPEQLYYLAKEWQDDISVSTEETDDERHSTDEVESDELPRASNKYYKKLVVGWLPNECPNPFITRLWPAVLKAASEGKVFSPDTDLIAAILHDEPRDCLVPRKRRRELVECLKPLLDISDDPVQLTTILVKAIYQYHSKITEENCGICRLGKFHDILYIACTLAVEYDIFDSDLISDIIKTIYKCEGGLDRIIVPAVLGPKLSHMLSGWYPDFNDVETARDSLSYFINHTTAAKLELKGPTGEQLRFLDTPLVTLQGAPPITVAVQSGDPESVAMLLTFGAEMETEPVHCPLRSAFNKLSNHARAIMGLRESCVCVRARIDGKKRFLPELTHPLTEMESFFEQINCEDIYELCPCELAFPIDWPETGVLILKLLLQSVSYHRLTTNAEILHPRILTDGLVEMMPKSLKQLSCLSIRKRIHENWGLPHGVYQLGLPPNLANYVSLARDYCC